MPVRKLSNVFAVIIFLISFPCRVFSQGSEDENIKKIVRSELNAFLDRDAKLWEKLWLHDDKVTRGAVDQYEYYTTTGWNSFGPKMISFLTKNPKPVVATLVTDSFIIRNYNNTAWVEFDLGMPSAPGTSDVQRKTREYRFLAKNQGEWQIVSQMSIDRDLYKLTPSTTEANINKIAFHLLDEKKIDEAVDMFKVNIKLYPASWHAYDSMGEAYATIGKKEMAIESYKKSLELNPGNSFGKAALEKLQGK